jgi:hypothetical protein
MKRAEINKKEVEKANRNDRSTLRPKETKVPPVIYTPESLYHSHHHNEVNEEELKGLGCPPRLIKLIRQLDRPENIQVYVGDHFHYDHSDTIGGLPEIVKSGKADCFRGALFLYTVAYFHGDNPRWCLLQAGTNNRDQDHNIIPYCEIFRFTEEYRWGALAMSSWNTLMYRPPVFKDLIELGRSYHQPYLSEYPKYHNEHTLIGISDPIDMVKLFDEKYGRGWFFRQVFQPAEEAARYIFDHYTDDLWCTRLTDGARYRYPGKPGDEIIPVKIEKYER